MDCCVARAPRHDECRQSLANEEMQVFCRDRRWPRFARHESWNSFVYKT